MKETMGSFNLGGIPEDERSHSYLERGDTVLLKELAHTWNEAKPEDPNAPHVAEGTAELEAGRNLRYCLLFLGTVNKRKPMSKADLEKRLNALGWFRRDNG